MLRGMLWSVILMAVAMGSAAPGIESRSGITAEVMKAEPWEGAEVAGVLLTFRVLSSENVGDYGNPIKAGDVVGELFDGEDISSTPSLAYLREGDVFTASVTMSYGNGRRWNMTDVRVIRKSGQAAPADGAAAEPSGAELVDAAPPAGGNPAELPALLGVVGGLAVLSFAFIKLGRKARN